MNRNKVNASLAELKRQIILIDKYDGYMKLNFEYDLGDIFEERDWTRLVKAVDNAALEIVKMEKEVSK